MEQDITKTNGTQVKLTAKDYASDQDVRWCPGCGDYSILAQVQRVMPSFNIPKEKTVFVAGIGCSSRFPYYMNTYGFHSIHGRASVIAAGIKMAKPDLDVWVATGDGDLLSIGGNHFIHLLRRNVNLTVLLFNNKIYGLTKGQYSPTSEYGKVTKSSPHGTIDNPFNPLTLALGSGGTLVARTMDRDPKHLQEMISRAHKHRGSSFLEIFQNCNIYNDGAYLQYTEKDTKPENVVYLEHGEPLVFGKDHDKGIKLDGFRPVVVSLRDGKHSMDDLIVHDETSKELAMIIAQFTEMKDFPVPVGVLYVEDRYCYEDEMEKQIEESKQRLGEGDLEKLLFSGNMWEVKEGQ
jgi:2-oxoglutarate/2-oxoacid ferredoxin oxidoreductase subunit beta